MPNIFAAPYAYWSPSLAFVLDDGARAVGYILGTSDTPRFVEEFRESWLPLVRERHPMPAGEPGTRDEQMAVLLHWPERMIVPEVADYPAHLHIDLLPEYQGRGYGRALASRCSTRWRGPGRRACTWRWSPRTPARAASTTGSGSASCRSPVRPAM